MRMPGGVRELMIGAALAALAACGGGDDDSGGAGDDASAATDAATDDGAATTGGGAATGDESGDGAGGGEGAAAGDGAGSAPASIEIDGVTYELGNVTCTVGDAFWGPDFRRVSADADGDFPGLSIGYAPPKADDEGVEDPNVVAFFPSADPWFYTTVDPADADVSLTEGGVTGSATMSVSGEGGPDGPVTASFDVTCPGGAGGSDGDGTADGAAEPSTAGPSSDEPASASGTVVVDGVPFELSGPTRSQVIVDPDADEDAASGDFDFEICETVNPVFEGDFNILGTLGDGTPFRLSGNVDEEPGELDGFFLGELPEEERAAFDELSLDGRTLSGSATTSRGPVEFSFSC